MNKAIKILTVALVLQVLLVELTNLERFKSNNSNQQARLLDLDWPQIDGLRISGKDTASVVMKKKSEQEWFLPDYHNLPVDQSKIEELLKKLKPLQTDWPVATTTEAAKRFEVNKDNFQRQLTFLQGEATKGTLFTGTSPGYRKVHARVDDQNEIYAIELSNFLASTSVEDWLKKSLLAVDLNPVKKIILGNIQLSKIDKEWVLDGLTANQKVNQATLQPLLDALTNFSVEAAFGSDPTILQNQPEIAAISFDMGSERHTLAFYEPKEGAHLILKSSQHSNYFKVNRAEAEKIMGVKREVLIENIVIENPVMPSAAVDDTAAPIESPVVNNSPNVEISSMATDTPALIEPTSVSTTEPVIP